MTRSRGILPRRRRWTSEEDALVRVAYHFVLSSTLSDWLMRSRCSVFNRAHTLGLSKDPEFVEATNSELGRKMANAGMPHRYPKGHVPANKGLRRPGWAAGRMKETQFKKGRPASEARNYKPIGSLRITRDGQLERKFTDDPSIHPVRRWKPVTRIVWEEAHGPIPPKHVVRFKDDIQRTVENEITLDKLEMISLADNMRRNTIHNLPAPLKEVVQLRGVLRRHINKREKANEHQHK